MAPFSSACTFDLATLQVHESKELSSMTSGAGGLVRPICLEVCIYLLSSHLTSCTRTASTPTGPADIPRAGETCRSEGSLPVLLSPPAGSAGRRSKQDGSPSRATRDIPLTRREMTCGTRVCLHANVRCYGETGRSRGGERTMTEVLGRT
eukprot:755299-Hanusia_phi.AAC.8